MTKKGLLIGFIGQGFIGKNYADDFESRGYSVVRYALEEPYIANKEKIKDCDIVFIAVPTPTTPDGFDYSIVMKALSLVSPNRIGVIKSTLLPGTTEVLQDKFKDIYIFHSPEFLREVTAAEDAKNPDRNIVGMPIANFEYEKKAKFILSILPQASYERICTSKESELVKYLGNSFLTTKVVFINMAYDLAQKIGADWETLAELFSNDPRIGKSHLNPIHASGRGAGGHCFIKDMEAFKQFYADHLQDDGGVDILESVIRKNNSLLLNSGKDLDILKGVYGESIN